MEASCAALKPSVDCIHTLCSTGWSHDAGAIVIVCHVVIPVRKHLRMNAKMDRKDCQENGPCLESATSSEKQDAWYKHELWIMRTELSRVGSHG
jgi:hypothetical protein